MEDVNFWLKGIYEFYKDWVIINLNNDLIVL